MNLPKIAVIILNYNSENDLFKCVIDLKAQKKVNLITIVVDNDSKIQTVKNIKLWSHKNFSDSVSGTAQNVETIIKAGADKSNTFFIYNDENKGYSAGNNIGIKVAGMLGAEAVLIANPDMQFPDKYYISLLYETLESEDNIAITSSKIIGLDNIDQSPLRESKFWEEFLWPLQFFPTMFRKTSYLLPYASNAPMEVPKVIGCSLLIRMDFLRKIKFFDEGVFLYSEEAILAKQVQKKNMKIIFTPQTFAVHAHVRSEKGNSALRMLNFIKSRKYYLYNHSDYGVVQKILLTVSYAFLSGLQKIKLWSNYAK